MNKNQKSKINEIKKILPFVWNSYEHMRNVRKVEVEGFRNFLLIVISFLPIISLTLFTHFNNEIFFVPIVFQILAFILLLKTFFVFSPQVPWINPDTILNEIDENIFETRFFIALKALENDTFIQLNENGKWIVYSIYSILISIYLLILGVLFIYFKNIILYILVSLLTVLSLYIYRFYHKQIRYHFMENCKKYSKKMEVWINEAKTNQ